MEWYWSVTEILRVCYMSTDLEDEMHFCCPNLAAHNNEPHVIHVMQFNSYKIFEELPLRLKEWQTNDELRVCKSCGYKASPLESPCKVPTP